MAEAADAPDLRELAEEDPEAYRAFAERVGDDFGDWLMGFLEEEGADKEGSA